jgi:hypothetical protein
MRTRTLSALVLVLALACDSSDKSKKGDAGGDGVNQGGVPQGCPAGTWIMDSVFCGNIDVTATVASEGGISDMQLQIADDGTTCTVVATVTGSTCSEVEEVTLIPDATGTHAVVSKGITDCQPAQCKFNSSDISCRVGDRASGATTSTTALKADGATLTVTTQPPDGLCGSFGQPTIALYTKF